ncbi:MAG: site-specific DNA-methyltransferase [Planctomycetota bacterium]
MRPHNQIILGDALETLKKINDDFVDVGVTSPPYNKGEKDKGWLVDRVKYHNISDVADEKTYQENQIAVLDEIYRITKPGGSFFYNHKLRWRNGVMIHPYSWVARTKWTLRQEIIWHRKIAANIRGWRFWQLEERIFWLHKPVGNDEIGEELKSRHALLGSIWEIRPEMNIGHPAPFPIALPARCIYSILDDKKGVVLDPYAGSGTTLVAAKLLGSDYLGIEISPEYVRMAQKRLAQSENERPLLIEETVKHIVRKTFKQRKENGEWSGRYRNGNPEKIGHIPASSQLTILEKRGKYTASTKKRK